MVRETKESGIPYAPPTSFSFDNERFEPLFGGQFLVFFKAQFWYCLGKFCGIGRQPLGSRVHPF